MAEFQEKATDAWLREWENGSVEIMLKAPGYRLRVFAPREEAIEAIELFERWTGKAVDVGQRPRRAVSVPKGQLSITSEL